MRRAVCVCTTQVEPPAQHAPPLPRRLPPSTRRDAGGPMIPSVFLILRVASVTGEYYSTLGCGVA